MCVETVRIYACGCEELEEALLCEYALQPGMGHISDGQPKTAQAKTVEINDDCDYCIAERVATYEAKEEVRALDGDTGSNYNESQQKTSHEVKHKKTKEGEGGLGGGTEGNEAKDVIDWSSNSDTYEVW